MSCTPYQCPGCPSCAPSRRPLTARDEARIQRALRHDPPVHGPRPLRLVQASGQRTHLSAPVGCDNSMTCDCDRCQQQRAVLIQFGPRKIRQPWERAA